MNSTADRLILPALLVLLPGISACSKGGPSGSPGGASALLITLDTTRRDVLSCYGGRPGVSPHLDRLAREGVLFENAYTVTPMTAPSHSSMLTGLYPVRHGVRINGSYPLAGAALTLAERARENGVQTAAFVSASVLDRLFGLAQGFDTFSSPPAQNRTSTMSYAARRAHDLVGEVTTWLDGRDSSRPFLLWVHLWDPHRPWEAAPQFARGRPYENEVASVDDAAGLVIEALRSKGLLDWTTVLVLGDHGEGLGEHGEQAHGALLYESTMRVPMILRYPGGRHAGTRVTGITSVVDVAPTLLEALGLPALTGLDGQSLFDQVPPDDRGVYLESYYSQQAYGWSQLSGWVDRTGKYIFGSRPVYFDLVNDPGELNPLLGPQAPESERYRSAILQVASRPALPRGTGDSADADLLSAVQKLGYVTAMASTESAPGPLEPTDGIDPQQRVSLLEMISEANTWLGTGQTRRAQALFARVVAQDPVNYQCQALLGTSLMILKRYQEAVGPLRIAVENGHDLAANLSNLGICLRSLGQDEEALVYFLQGLERDANHVKCLLNAAEIHSAAGREAEAQALRQRYEQLEQLQQRGQ